MSDPTRDEGLASSLALLAPEVDMEASRALFDRERDGRPHRRWVVFPAAAIVVGLGVAGLFVLADREPATNAPATQPTAPMTEPTPVTEPPIGPEPTVAPTGVPSSDPPPPINLGPVNVAEVWVDGEYERTVLHEATVGARIDQLGVEDCTECDPMRPWAPIALPDGRVVIADNVNERWVIVSDGEPAVFAFGEPDGRIGYPIAQPIIDAAGSIYALFPHLDVPAGSSNSAEVRVYDPDDLSAPIAVHPAADVEPFAQLWIGPDGLDVAPSGDIDGLGAIAGQPAQAPTVVWHTSPGTSPSLDVTWDGATRTWEFPAGWAIGGMGRAAEFDDGSTLVQTWNEADPQDDYWLLLRPDGTATRWPAPASAALNGGLAVSRGEIITLERTNSGSLEAVQYRLLPAGAAPTTPDPTAHDDIQFVDPDQPTRSASVFGYEYGSVVDLDEVIATISADLAPPDHDTGWQPMPESLSCKGATEYRSILWDDLRLEFERMPTHVDRLAAWSVGDTELLLSPPRHAEISSASGLTSASGLGIGSPKSAIMNEGFSMVGDDAGRVQALTGIAPVMFELTDGAVSAFSIQDNDC